MNREEAIYKAKHLRKVHPSICIDAEDFWETVIAALEQEPCEDCISRQAAIRAIEALQLPIMREESNYYQFKFSGMSEAREAVENLPSVTPAEKVGHWTKDVNDARELFDTVRYYCSACGDWQGHGPCKYCPNCGAKMSEIPTSCSTCILDRTDACSRGAGRAVDDEACEDYLASPTGSEGSEES